MKKIILIAFFAIATTLTYAQGIEFFKGTFEEAKVKAAKENKKIFVDVFTTWCGPCKKMAKEVFPDKVVGDYFNKSFVSLKLDAENQANHDFFKSFKATAFPTYFWVDENGTLLDTQSGSMGPDAFIEMAKNAVNAGVGAKRAALQKRWESGERTPSIMREYVLGVLPEINAEAVYPAMIEYLNGLSKEQLNRYETYDLFKGFCQPRDGFLKDDIITKTYFANMKEYEKYSDKYSAENQSFTNVIYRTFVRMHSSVYLGGKNRKEADEAFKKSIGYVKGLDFVYRDFCLACLDAEKLIYTGQLEKGITKMAENVQKYGEIFPSVRNCYMYTLIIGKYFINDKKPLMNEVLKMATDNLAIAPSKTSLAYYAAANYAAGNTQEAYSALAWMHLYDGQSVSNAVYDKMNIKNIRSKFPTSTPETEAEKSRLRTLLKDKK